MVLPRKKKRLREHVLKRKFEIEPGKLENKVSFALAQVMHQELLVFRTIERIRKVLIGRELGDIFRAISKGAESITKAK